MPGDELPVTKDAHPEPIDARAALTNTTAPLTQALAEATPGLDFSSYDLMERLGGGTGDVYRAVDPALERDLVIKVMKADLQGDAAAEQRFIGEARVIGTLQHPGIVPIYNLGRLNDGRLHYTMRLVRGRTLAAILKEEGGGRECLRSLLTIFEKICQALAYAHSKRVVHRDLKPANVMVGRFGEVQVMDWGLAKLLIAGERDCLTAPNEPDAGGTRIHTEAGEAPSEQTRMGREMGTPAYMPPEQALGEWDSVDERADVFALGAMLCEILTGQPPYNDHEIEPALRQAKRGDCAEASARLQACGADAALLSLCRECLAPMRERRPRDGEQVAQHMAAYQAEVQERLRRAELERAAAVVQARWERQRRSWILAAALLLLVGVAVSAWLAVRATTAEERALTAADAERQAKDLAQMRLGQIEKAADAERQAKDLAQMRLKKIEKAKEILISIFRDLDPRAEAKGGPSLQLQLGQHLERAAAELDTGAAGDPVDAARLQNVLGYSLISLDKTELAIELLNKAGKTLESKLGPDHPMTLAARSNLANVYRSVGRVGEAIHLLEQTLKQKEAKLGPDHPSTLHALASLGVFNRDAGRLKEAISLLETALQRGRRRADGLPANIAWAPGALAESYEQDGQFAKAEPIFRDSLEQAQRQFGSDDLRTAVTLVQLGVNLLKQKKFRDAEPPLRQSLSIREKKQSDAWNTYNTRSVLGEALLGQKRYTEAEPLLLQGYEGVKQRQDKIPPAVRQVRLNEALERLVRLYEAADQKAKADEWRRKLEEVKTAKKKTKS
jgi:serine/threonine protein kinase